VKPQVLFLCTGNSARSQMAEGYLRHVASERFAVMSAGICPRGVHPLAIEAMKEVGIDISGQQSKDVQQLLGTSVQFVVTVCSNAKERCPFFPADVKHAHWDIEDPASVTGTEDEKLTAFRVARDKLFAQIRSFVAAVQNSQKRP
jgi:arsenate reductase